MLLLFIDVGGLADIMFDIIAVVFVIRFLNCVSVVLCVVSIMHNIAVFVIHKIPKLGFAKWGSYFTWYRIIPATQVFGLVPPPLA